MPEINNENEKVDAMIYILKDKYRYIKCVVERLNHTLTQNLILKNHISLFCFSIEFLQVLYAK